MVKLSPLLVADANWKMTIQEQSLKQISSELHDNICQSLLLAIMHLQQMEKSVEQEKLAETIILLQETLQETHQLSRSINGDLVLSIGLHAAIQKLIDRINKVTSIKTTFQITGEESYLSNEVELVLFRVIQEALNNVVKHSNACSAQVFIQYEKEFVRVRITDDGIGFNQSNTQEGGAGMNNMETRVREKKGKWKAESFPGKGCTVSFKIPLLKPTL